MSRWKFIGFSSLAFLGATLSWIATSWALGPSTEEISTARSEIRYAIQRQRELTCVQEGLLVEAIAKNRDAGIAYTDVLARVHTESMKPVVLWIYANSFTSPMDLRKYYTIKCTAEVPKERLDANAV